MSDAQSTHQSFHIPAGSMVGALDRFEAQRGLRLICDSKATKHAYTVGVNGWCAPMLALEMLFTCTGVHYHFISSYTVILRRFVVAPAIHLSGNINSPQ
jgi:hypothetical protein